MKDQRKLRRPKKVKKDNFGDGGAGKTTVFDLLYSALDDNYFVNLSKSTFEKGNNKIDKIFNSMTSNTR
jgi:uridine kinase